jgi:hypothetical protein
MATMQELRRSKPEEQQLIDWAMQEIELLSFDMWPDQGKANLK